MVLQGLKDVAYKSVVGKDADELKERLGFKDEIVSYLGGEDAETGKIPNRKSAYALLYEKLIEKLKEDDAVKLAAKKDLFIIRRQVSILWEEFGDKVAEKEEVRKKEQEKQLALQKEILQKKLEKVQKLKRKLESKEEQLLIELQQYQTASKEEVKKIDLSKEAVAEGASENTDPLETNQPLGTKTDENSQEVPEEAKKETPEETPEEKTEEVVALNEDENKNVAGFNPNVEEPPEESGIKYSPVDEDFATVALTQLDNNVKNQN